MRPVRALGAIAMLGALTLTGCGDDGSGGKAPAGGDRPVTVQAANGSVTIPARPKRIVSLSPSHTETLFAIGAGPQVVAVDDQSDYPAGVPKTSLSGFKPNAEAVIGYKPDLVVLSDDINGIVKALGRVQIPVVLEPAPAKLDDAYDEITDLGTATGHAGQARTVTDTMRRDIAAAVPQDPSKSKGLSYYHELTNDLHTVTSSTFIGQLYGAFGLTNIADKAQAKSGGYPQLSREYLLKADPAMIFLADTRCCGQSAAAVVGRPGWRDLTAVRKSAVIALDDDIASRWGPRLAEFAKTIGAAVRKTATPG